MNDKVLFMIIDNEVKYLAGSNMDHREWYTSLGLDVSKFDSIVRGFVIDGKIVFFKGSMFNYDDEVISAACIYSPSIRITMNNPSLEVYCGIVINGAGQKWEPVVKIGEDEITGFVKKEEPVKKEEVVYTDNGPLIEFKNDVQDVDFSKRAILVTLVVLVISIIIKVILFSGNMILKTSNFLDVLLVVSQVVLLLMCIKGYKEKSINTKYFGVAASILLVLTFDFFDVVLGILYFLFSIDQNILIKIGEIIKLLIEKIKKKGNK